MRKTNHTIIDKLRVKTLRDEIILRGSGLILNSEGLNRAEACFHWISPLLIIMTDYFFLIQREQLR